MFRIMVLSFCVFCANPFIRNSESKRILSSEFPKHYNGFDDYSFEIDGRNQWSEGKGRSVEDFDSDDDIIIYESDLSKLDKNNNAPMQQYESMYYNYDSSDDHHKHRKHSLPKVHKHVEPIVTQPKKGADTSSSEEVMTYEFIGNIFAGMDEKGAEGEDIIIEIPVAEFNNLEYESNEDELLPVVRSEEDESKEEDILEEDISKADMLNDIDSLESVVITGIDIPTEVDEHIVGSVYKVEDSDDETTETSTETTLPTTVAATTTVLTLTEATTTTLAPTTTLATTKVETTTCKPKETTTKTTTQKITIPTTIPTSKPTTTTTATTTTTKEPVTIPATTTVKK